MKRTLLGFFILLFTISFGFSQTFVEEDFESGSIPGDWSNITNASDGGWLVGNAATLEVLIGAYLKTELPLLLQTMTNVIVTKVMTSLRCQLPI